MDSLSSSTTTSNINMEEIIITPPQHIVEASLKELKKDLDKDNIDSEMLSNFKTVLVKNLSSYTKKKYALLKAGDDSAETMKSKPNGVVEHLENIHNTTEKSTKYNLPKFKAICQYIESCDENFTADDQNSSDNNTKSANDNMQFENYNEEKMTTTSATATTTANVIEDNNQILPWHKLLVAPPKQMVVIERINSGARRFVVIDFGSPVVLTDLVIPACDELSSLFIDIWCFDEETDSTRLAVTQDIGIKTLVLSDLHPAPICRYMKITIVGRYGMSATRCKFPIGSFYGHLIVLESDIYSDSLLNCMKAAPTNINTQIKTLNSLYEDVNCRHNLSCNKLIELLTPLLKGDLSNLAHMHAFVNKQKDDESMVDNHKIITLYEECITLQHQMNVIRNVINRLEVSVNPKQDGSENTTLQSVSKDKLRVLSECLTEILLHLSLEYGLKNVFPLHSFFTMDVANRLFNTLVVCGDAYIQLSTCSLLVRMCCFQNWWGDFVANIFCNLFSSQNTKIFPQDRIFFLLTYLGRRSIAMGSCRSIIIDSILKTIAKLLAPISPRYDRANLMTITGDSDCDGGETNNLWIKTDLQLITWLILFLSICLDEQQTEKRDKSANRWEFMSCETDFTKSRAQSSNNNGKNFPRCFKKRNIQQTKYNGLQPYTDWGKKIYMLQNEVKPPTLPEIFMELSGKVKAMTAKPTSASSSAAAAASASTGAGSSSSVTAPSTATATAKTSSVSTATTSAKPTCSQKNLKGDASSSSFLESSSSSSDNSFNSGLRSIKLTNIIVVIRGLIALILEMDFTVNMDLFLLTSKVIARLVSACRPSIQLSKVITTQQLEQLIRLAVWNDQQQPWAVHAITCLLQDLLDADKNYRGETFETDNICSGSGGGGSGGSSGSGGGENSQMEGVIEAEEAMEATGIDNESSQMLNSHVVKDISYADTVKYGQLPSLIECEDNEIDELLTEIENLDRGRNLRKDTIPHNKNTLNYFCKGISSALDARLGCGLDTNVQILIRRLTMMSSLDLYTSLPQVPSNDMINTTIEQTAWPEYITNAWSGPEYNCGLRTNQMFKDVFDSIFADLHLQDTWVHLQQVLQIWLTLNTELSDKAHGSGLNQNSVPKIPFGPNAVEGLLMALAWHNDIKLHTWCLGFQCLILACNIHSNLDKNSEYGYDQKIGYVIIMDENFEKMLLRFFSGHGMNSPMAANRCVGPTICKYLHELLLWLQMKAEFANQSSNIKRKLKNTLLNVVLQLTQPGGAIYNQQGPIDAQSQLIRDLISIQYDKADLTIAMNIIESVSFLVYNNIANAEKIQCRRLPDMNGSNNAFGNLFATVLGADNSLIISLLKLCSSLVQTELQCRDDELQPVVVEMENESQTDEIKAEQLNNEQKKKGGSFVVDQVLLHFPTMKRLLSSLSHCSSSSFTTLAASSTTVYSIKSTTDINCSINELQTTADAVFHLLMLLCEKASHPKLIVTPIYQYLETSFSSRNVLPRLLLSEPLLWYILKVLDTPSTVSIFNELGGMRIICQNLVQCKRFLVNMQPGLISLIMQHMTKNSSLNDYTNQALSSAASSSSNSKKSSHQYNKSQERLVNFAPFCSISSENTTAQPANVLIQTPMSAHRRARTPAWNYMFYPDETHVDLTLTLPTAILLSEIQIQPHIPTLATCPSAVAVEISRDNGLGPIPFGQALTTAGMTCIRLKLSRPEIATSVVLRLYRPKDSSNIGLTQISVLGTTIFRSTSRENDSTTTSSNIGQDDSLARTSMGWIRILSRCFSVATFNPDSDISRSVISSAISYPGFLESCCYLMNLMPSIPSNLAMQNLETVLFKLGEHSKDVFLTLIKILLYDTVPQTYRLCNDAICDLLFDLCTRKDSFVGEKIHVLINWVIKLRQNYGNKTLLTRCTNPQCGFIKCIASILWNVHTENIVPNLVDLITYEAFEACLYWIDVLEDKEPLKIAFDSLLCSLCCIKPELFNILLKRVGVVLVNQSMNPNFTDSNSGGSVTVATTINSLSSTSLGSGIAGTSAAAAAKTEGLTDDNKGEGGSTWFKNVATQNLSTLLLKPTYLDTLAAACQSPLAVYQLVDSGLPKMLSYALYEYCCTFSSSSSSSDARSTSSSNENSQPNTSMSVQQQQQQQPSTSSSCLTDSDKVENNVEMTSPNDCNSLININHVPELLDFFTECCSEGYMRDWLGSYQGSIFWKPLLELLANYQQSPSDVDIESESLQQSFIRMERSTINFFSKVTTCHPKNQETLTSILISVISQPKHDASNGGSSSNSNNSKNKPIISGFTRRLVLQILLESERILISVRSKIPMQKRDYQNLMLISNHPSKRVNSHHILLYLSTNTKCQEILQNCMSVYGNILPPSVENNQTKQSECSNGSSTNFCSNGGNSTSGGGSTSDTGKEIFELSNFANMEFLSVAAGVTAKDKRLKDVKNQAAALKDKEIFPKFTKLCSTGDDLMNSLSNAGATNGAAMNFVELVHPDCPDVILTADTTISQMLAILYNRGFSLSTPCLYLNLVSINDHNDLPSNDSRIKCNQIESLPSPLQKFSSRGGLLLLAHYLPTIYPDCTTKSSSFSNIYQNQNDKEKSPPMNDWVKVESNDDVYEDLEETLAETTSTTKIPSITSVPQHSLAAFGLFLRLPAYSDVLLRDKIKAQCLLRLVLGVTGDGEGNDIYSLSLASTLPTLPFEVFRQLLDSSPLTTDDGVLLRRMTIDVGAMHLILNYLGIFTHQSHTYQLTGPQMEFANGMKNAANKDDQLISDDKSHVYWAKGTGFGTGSTQKSWDVEQALLRQKSEEEHVTVLLQVLSSYVNPGDIIPRILNDDEIINCHDNLDENSSNDSTGGNIIAGELPSIFPDLLQQSCLIPALSSYLRNDSVLDITRHIPLYRSILQLLRAISISTQLVSLLKPCENGELMSIASLLANMKRCVDTYAKRLKVNKKSNIKGQTQKVTVNIDDGDDEGLALLIPDIQETADLVHKATYTLTTAAAAAAAAATKATNSQLSENANDKMIKDKSTVDIERPLLNDTIEQRYLEVMKKLQFDTYEMITESENGFRFVVSHHFENNVRMAGDRGHPSRVKRLAQETVTISTSLPLSYSSSVFVRCDTDRLDIMKVLITGPADTPYANGCFEFDVYFPPDYPNSPMLINLETTGRHSVRFNPNLYNDGKVCLSVLNTWHGRPEEKWNAQTSSFLQVLVSIQSLILVPEPYFNEPGFERSRGTPTGTHCSKEYNSNIYQACVRWAMLEQIRNPSPCFRDVIHTHFWLKRHEICAQIENWLEELGKPQCNEKSGRTISFNAMVLRRQYRQLREELARLQPPEGLEDLELPPFNPSVSFLDSTTSTTAIGADATSTISVDALSSTSTATQSVSVMSGSVHSNSESVSILNEDEEISMAEVPNNLKFKTITTLQQLQAVMSPSQLEQPANPQQYEHNQEQQHQLNESEYSDSNDMLPDMSDWKANAMD